MLNLHQVCRHCASTMLFLPKCLAPVTCQTICKFRGQHACISHCYQHLKLHGIGNAGEAAGPGAMGPPLPHISAAVNDAAAAAADTADGGAGGVGRGDAAAADGNKAAAVASSHRVAPAAAVAGGGGAAPKAHNRKQFVSQITPPSPVSGVSGPTPVSQAGFRRLVPGKGQQLTLLSVEVHADTR